MVLCTINTMILWAAVVISISCVGGGSSPPSPPPSWMIFPGEDGSPHLVDLRGPAPPPRVDPASDVTFHLYTRSNPTTPVQMKVGDLNGAHFDPSKPTKVIVHGFTSDAFVDWVIEIKNNFILAEDCNVVALDWSDPASGPLYNHVRANARPTGEYLATMLDYLSSQGASLSSMHCVGHSLGAHVCGFAGKVLKTGLLGRITGLDPALPLFHLDTPEERLANTDATFVDVIHTCGGWLGFQAAIGHADFYPNGGKLQPGCGMDLIGSCSHSRAHQLFAESVLSPRFSARPCDSWTSFQGGACAHHAAATMGGPAHPSTRGSYFLSTGARSLFALG